MKIWSSNKNKDISLTGALARFGGRVTWYVLEWMFLIVFISYFASFTLNATLMTTVLTYASMVYIGTMIPLGLIIGHIALRFVYAESRKVKRSAGRIRDAYVLKYVVDNPEVVDKASKKK